ncbi:serine hydrolase domain-containing protein [Steroidobacter sp.]|uniref:serine hydrolase domain-containing protein n=1 Tax=Steroidobacter sp. TaxID=1978227 RepID=UPI001A3B0105|nr:serine hydrolase domain-containing protein [Steroidobacter sp.]MBL8271091.1 beta-lactamase family protein [Steroidobacter sp.]
MSLLRYVAAALGSLCCLTASAADRYDDIREYIRAGLVSDSVPSIAVAVAQNGKIVWQEGFGWADKERRIPATEHSMYLLASVSKSMTATALMTLVEQGKVQLDAPVNNYLGNVKLHSYIGNANDATVRQLLNHTSGLPTHLQFFYFDEPYRQPSRDETLLRYGNLFTVPGETYKYSNLGFGTLDYIVERSSGENFADYLRRSVFLPLGMTHSSLHIGKGMEDFAAMRYFAQDGAPIPYFETDAPGAGAMYSSAHDLLRFGMFHLQTPLKDQKAILSKSSLEQMHRPSVRIRDHYYYGLGFFVKDEQGHHMVMHGGGSPGVTANLTMFPDRKLAIVVLCNQSAKLPTRVLDRAIAKFVPGWHYQDSFTWPAPVEPRVAFDVPPSLLGQWRGTLATYTGEQSVTLNFMPNGEVHGRVGQQPIALINDPAFADGVFQGQLAARVGTPDTDRYDYVVSLSLQLKDNELAGTAMANKISGGLRQRSTLAHWLQLQRVSGPSAL